MYVIENGRFYLFIFKVKRIRKGWFYCLGRWYMVDERKENDLMFILFLFFILGK